MENRGKSGRPVGNPVDFSPLVAFADERLPLFQEDPTHKEKDPDFSYFMQRDVVGAPGMSDEALAFYSGLFQRIYDSPKWQDYMEKKSLMGAKLDGDDLKAYWVVQRDRHEAMLKASGAIK